MKSLLASVVLVVLALCGIAEGGAPKVIMKVPFTITKPGQYQLGRSFEYTGTGYAITIAADDVTLDLRGNVLTSPGTTSQVSETAGIFALDRKNVTIRNGMVRGFFRGIYLEATDTANGGHLVEDVRADRSTFLGIQVKGNGSILRRNRVTTVDGATSYTYIRYGMDVRGDGVVVTENQIFDLRTAENSITNLAYGINIVGSSSPQVTRNMIAKSTGVYARGIRLSSCAYAVVAGNQVSKFVIGVELEECNNTIYRDNSAAALVVKYSVTGGSVVDGGGNQ